MDVELRGAIPADHEWIVRVADHWWGRPIVAVIPRLFLDHFHPTSLIATIGGEPVGFLVAFQSPARPTEGYVHFVGSTHATATSDSVARSTQRSSSSPPLADVGSSAPSPPRRTRRRSRFIDGSGST